MLYSEPLKLLGFFFSWNLKICWIGRKEPDHKGPVILSKALDFVKQALEEPSSLALLLRTYPEVLSCIFRSPGVPHNPSKGRLWRCVLKAFLLTFSTNHIRELTPCVTRTHSVWAFDSLSSGFLRVLTWDCT